MTTLYYKDGVSDKVYQVNVVECIGGYNVNFAYGRRGSTMNTGVKNSTPLTHFEATKMANKLVVEKMAKGYTPGEDGKVYKDTDSEERFTGILPMLLNAIPEEEIGTYINNDDWTLQNKYDGKRMMIRKQGDKVEAINRKGLLIGAPQDILDSVAHIPDNFILDGECVGEIYYAFDVVDTNLRLHQRLIKLRELLSYVLWDSAVTMAPWYSEYQSKKYYADIMKNGGYEGLVFKKLSSYYIPGRPATGGNALKCKFVATVNVRVTGINVQRSVEIALENGTPCGNVSIPPNKAIPLVGNIIEVRYLYAMPGSNALYQPVYSRVRDDIYCADAIGALKYTSRKYED